MLVMKGGLVKPRLCADLTKLAEFNSGLNGLRNMHTVRLVNIPALVKASNPYAFAELKEFTVENASLLEKNPAIVEKRKQDALRKQSEEEERKRRREEEKRREEEERKKRQEKGIVLEPDDYHRVPLHVKTLLISGCGVGGVTDWVRVFQLCEQSECSGTEEAEECGDWGEELPEREQRQRVGCE